MHPRAVLVAPHMFYFVGKLNLVIQERYRSTNVTADGRQPIPGVDRNLAEE